MFQFINKQLIAGLSLLILILIIGSVGYAVVEGMSLFEGFYMTFITITTIGFGEVHQLSTYGRLLTIIISVMGIGVLAFIATNSTQVILEAIFFKDRFLKNRIKKMENHYIICGYGRIGRRIVEELLAMDLSVVVVENPRCKIFLGQPVFGVRENRVIRWGKILGIRVDDKPVGSIEADSMASTVGLEVNFKLSKNIQLYGIEKKDEAVWE